MAIFERLIAEAGAKDGELLQAQAVGRRYLAGGQPSGAAFRARPPWD